jgi:hypothetical protein
MEKFPVFFEVQSELLNIIQTSFDFKGLKRKKNFNNWTQLFSYLNI